MTYVGISQARFPGCVAACPELALPLLLCAALLTLPAARLDPLDPIWRSMTATGEIFKLGT